MIATKPPQPPASRFPQPENPARSPRRRARTSTVSTRSLSRAGAAVAIAATLLLTAYIGEFASISIAGRKGSALRAELRRAKQENTNLHAQAQILERPQRIDQLARQLGMEQRSAADYVALAPLPPPPVEPERTKPILAGFLPERWTGLLGDKR